MNKQFEEELRNIYCSMYSNANPNTLLYKEVPAYTRSVDLVEYNTSTNEISAIEFKIKDWKRAIMQLSEVAVCFDYLMLCMPKPKTKKCISNIKSSCKSLGIGLCFFDQITNQFSTEYSAKNIHDIWRFQKESIIGYLESQEENHE